MWLWSSDEEVGGYIVVVDVGVGYAEVDGYEVLSCGVEVGRDGPDVGMPRAWSEDAGIGVECRCDAVSVCCEAEVSCFTG